eukprot:m.323506 g.323506  ORF g.323506 m.323506 type:complete len:208 (-) comp20358_c1_seq4:304-927(-)
MESRNTMHNFTASSAEQAISKAGVAFHEVKQLMYAESNDNSLSQKLEELKIWIVKAEELHYKEPPQRRVQLKQRIEQLNFDYNDLKRTIDERNRQQKKSLAESRRRELLLGKKFTAHSGDAYIDMLGADLEHNSRLGAAGRAMNDIILHGAAIKETLVSQRGVIKVCSLDHTAQHVYVACMHLSCSIRHSSLYVLCCCISRRSRGVQ